MSPTQRQASNTLPRNFVFHSHGNNDLPKTPEPQVNPASYAMSPPRLEPYRLRRTRQRPSVSIPSILVSTENHLVPPTLPVQSVVPIVAIPPGPVTSFQSQSSPRTPFAQTTLETPLLQDINPPPIPRHVDFTYQYDNPSRPSTACSAFSDSSASVASSLDSFSSFEDLLADPHANHSEKAQQNQTNTLAPNPSLSSCPSLQHNPQQQPLSPTKMSKRTKPVFSDEMDSHLWKIYMRYLSNPKNTPFRILPGAAPPFGVCYRVAQEAKKTWRCIRKPHPVMPFEFVDSPETLRAHYSGSTTPTPSLVANTITTTSKPHLAWPRSARATRKRLIELCQKDHSSLPSHSSRMVLPNIHAPNLSMSSMGVSIFATRDLNISLVASTSAAIANQNQMTEQFQLPLPQSRPHHQPCHRTSFHQKSRSLHIEPSSMCSLKSSLASPFQPRSRAVNNAVRPIPSSDLAPPPSFPSGLVPGTSLASLIELHVPTLPKFSLKRRDQTSLLLGPVFRQHEDDDLLLQNQPVIPGISTRRVRPRGFSLGDVSESSRRLSRAANTIGSIYSSNRAGFALRGGELLPPFNPPATRRLGSPFGETQQAQGSRFNTYPRRGLESMVEEKETTTLKTENE